ncbi:hypothetical protein HYN59_13785 [Flavobacterium album]|uniref:Uncharacterized protein n=1 Tax=Flavobacterium album TaxID=2175091 RepID=A0A2S1R0H6_9FLAO|nr:hypothetical protein [Flavobacterium album]AWH86114.1 hypothetical protein HYN59_13785 [Flavobacterium album]
MKDYGLKLRHILIIFIKVTITTVIFYLLSYYLFVIKIEIHFIDYFTDYILPVGLSTLSTTIWIRPKLKLLVFNSNSDPLLFYYFICIGHMTWLMVAAASWLVLATNPLISLNNVQESENIKTRFYKIEDYTIDTRNTSFSYSIEKIKKERYYYMDLYFVAPFLIRDKNGYSDNYKYWIIKEYYNKQSTDIDKELRNKYFDDFIKTAEKDFKERGYAYHANHFERIMYSIEKKHALKAIHKITPGIRDKDVIVFISSQKDLGYEKRRVQKIIYIASLSGILTLMLTLIFPGFNHRKLKSFAGKNPLSEIVNLLFKN